MQNDVLSIEEAFGDLGDPRSRTSAHDLTEMLVVALCAILSGADSWVAIQVWGEEKLDWLRRHFALEQGIPSHDTFGRVFAALDPRQFEACFIRWMSCLFPNLADQVGRHRWQDRSGFASEWAARDSPCGGLRQWPGDDARPGAHRGKIERNHGDS